MSTRAPEPLKNFSREWVSWENRINGVNSAEESGIVGDTRHQREGGYHISREDQPSDNYSVIRPDDRLGPSDCAAAVDVTYNNQSAMWATHERLRKIWRDRTNHPAARIINAWNGWDGKGEPGRYDMVTGSVKTATPDHKWHIHLEFRRKYVEDYEALDSVFRALVGKEPMVMNLGDRVGGTATPQHKENRTVEQILGDIWCGVMLGKTSGGDKLGVGEYATSPLGQVGATLSDAQLAKLCAGTVSGLSDQLGIPIDRMLSALRAAGESLAGLTKL